MERFYKSEVLFGKENMEKLKNSHILVVGVGGVGGYVCEVLARGGVGKISIVDFDIVSETNVNRQIIALTSTIGRPKVEVMKERIFEINPSCCVAAFNLKLDALTIKTIFKTNFDFVIDAVDDINAKLILAKFCLDRGIKIISSMGAGNKTGIPKFVVEDIYKTQNDPLAKKFRKIAKENNIKSLLVCYCPENSIKVGKEIGSTSYFPPACGITIGAYVINKLLM